MTTDFNQTLSVLLPEVYRSDDMLVFLGVIAPTLNDIRDLITSLPDLRSIDQCPAKYLVYLERELGLPDSGTLDEGKRRRAIAMAVERYRRRCSLSGIQQDAIRAGLDKTVTETWRSTIRLGIRATLNRTFLPGKTYNYGVCFVADGLSAEHRPAGFRFIQVIRQTHGQRLTPVSASVCFNFWESVSI